MASARRRIGLTFLDQAVSSASSTFLTGVVIARIAGAAEFGEYALVWILWLVVVGAHRALVAEAVIVSARESGDERALVSSGVAADLLLGLGASAVAAVGGLVVWAAGSHLGVLLLAFAPWFPSLLVQDFWRAMAFRDGRPERALLNDVVFAAVQVGAIVVALAVWRHSAAVVAAWGLGATAGAVLGLRWFPATASLRAGWTVLRRMWDRSRWLLADFLTMFTSDWAYVAFAALLMPAAEYGGFRAALSLMGPNYMIAIACGNVGLPAAARRAGPGERAELRAFARRMSAGTTAAIGAYGLAVAVAGGPVLRLLYGAEFGRFAAVATLAAIGYTLLGLVYGQFTALKVTGKMRALWRVRIAQAAIALAVLVVAVRWLGTVGAGWAAIAGPVCYVLAVARIYRSELPADDEAGAVVCRTTY